MKEKHWDCATVVRKQGSSDGETMEGEGRNICGKDDEKDEKEERK